MSLDFTISDIQKVAKEQNSTLVEYSIAVSEIYIWVISPTGNITFRRANLQPLETLNKTLGNLEEIIIQARLSIGIEEKDSKNKPIKLETEYIRQIQDNQSSFPLLKLLYEILINPIQDLLPTNPESPVIFIPHYQLFLVPFAALQKSDNSYLLEAHTPLIAPSIQVLQRTHQQYQKIRGISKKSLVVAEPTLHENVTEKLGLQQYPDLQQAGEAIAQILEATTLTGSQATKVAVINQMLETKIVHIFAHAVVGELKQYETKRILETDIPGAIILAPEGEDEGICYAEDILKLQLNLQLLVLCCCSTGKGNLSSDGIVGLSRCFILAGVPSLIVSLWNIGAPSAKVLMSHFYRNLSLGENRASALRHAMLETKKRFPTPKAWAGFALIGETEPLTLSIQQIKEA